MSRFAVIGVGNPSRGDDAVGPFVASLVRNAVTDPRLRVDSTPCEPSRFLDALEAVDAAIVVDAFLADNSGEILVFGWSEDRYFLSPGERFGMSRDAMAENYEISPAYSFINDDPRRSTVHSPCPLPRREGPGASMAFPLLQEPLGGGGYELPPLIPTTSSTHGFDLYAILALGCTLQALPPKLWVVAVAGNQFEIGQPMSREVRLGAVRATGKIVCEVCRWLNDSND